MATDANSALAAALDRLWIQFQPQMQERLSILEDAAHLSAAGSISFDEQVAASSAAHKLAGALGTFGLTRGTVLARELEVMYSREDGPDPALAGQLTSLAEELRAIVNSRK
jgi:HPt (histidine-containing phosphotransfer) domain-containing protein